jgi:peptidoglycan glycosyltransferase
VNAPLRKAGLVLVVLFGLLFLQLNVIMVLRADQYRNDTKHNNVRLLQEDYERQRGTITTVGGDVVVASSAPTLDSFKYLRSYPQAAAYAHVVGFRPVYGEMTGVEALENQTLNGTDSAFAADRLLEMFTGKKSNGGNVRLSIEPSVQEKAYDALTHNSTGSTKGAVVALDPATGAILAMISAPSFDPNPLVSHDYDTAEAAYQKLLADPNQPLLNRAVSETFPPGSAFKVIVAASALEHGLTPSSSLPGGVTYMAPGTTMPIKNASASIDAACVDQITLQDALRVSCNTAFARYCVEQSNAGTVKQVAQAFGFEQSEVLDGDSNNVLNVAASHTGDLTAADGSADPPTLAQSCIGQRDVRWTPLQAALVAASIADDGVQMRPYLIDSTLDADARLVYQVSPRDERRPVSSEVAGELRQMMDAVVHNGTGTKAQIDGFEVGGKTGTAQNDDAPDHGWFIGYARTSSGQPAVAVAVLIQNAGSGASAEAAAIAGQVMRAALAAKGLM